MANSTKEIRKKIRSIRNTAKMTRAMEMISAVKSRRAQAATLASRPYAATARQFIATLPAGMRGVHHPLLARREIKRAGIVLVSANRGLCGAFNAEVIRQAASFSRELRAQGVAVEFVTLGRKGRDAVVRQGEKLAADFPKGDLAGSASEVFPLSQFIVDAYLAKQYDQVSLVSTDFISTLKQQPVRRVLLPLEESQVVARSASEPLLFEYLFEPSAEVILDGLLRRLIDVVLYQAVLEASAAEHAARMVAMKNATDNALDLVDAFTLSFNEARQSAITREVAEISAGRLALEG